MLACGLFLRGVDHLARVGLAFQERLQLIGLLLVDAVVEEHFDGEVFAQRAAEVVGQGGKKEHGAHKDEHHRRTDASSDGV